MKNKMKNKTCKNFCEKCFFRRENGLKGNSPKHKELPGYYENI